jgi:two-component system cell cycle sensor histidine kinase/response regulator CckA
MVRVKRYLKYFLPAFLCVVLFGATIFMYILPRAETALMAEKREMVKELASTVCSLLETYEKQVQDGLLSRTEAQERAIRRVKELRYGPNNKDYFWINDLTPRMVMHPYQPGLNGQDLTQYADPNGVHLFVEMVEVAKDRGAGWVSYSWQWKDDATRIVPKISYVYLFKPWDWIVGTGIYLEDVRSELRQWVRHLIITGIVVFLLIAALSGYLAYRSLRSDTEREKTLDALRSSEQKFASAFREFPGWVVISTLDRGIYLEVNDTFLNLTGYHRNEIIGRSALDLGTWVDPEDRRQAMRILEEQGYVRNLEVKRRIATGQALDMLFSCEIIEIDGEKCLLSISLDISERKQAERAIRKHEKDMRSVLDAVSETIVLVDRMGKVLAANQTVCKRLGTTMEELVGRSIFDFFPPAVAETRRRRYDQVFITGRSVSFEDSREGFLFEQNVYPLFSEEGSVEAVAIFARDVTEARRSEETKVKLEAQLRQAQKMEAIGTLAGGIAHDFNNILGAIMGYGELAELEAQKGKDNREHLEQIIKAAERARDLVKQILTFSRRSEIDLKPVDLNQLVTHSVNMLGHTIPKMIDIKMNLAGNLDPVKADANQLEQVIMNLAGNAKDAMPDGGELVFETSLICLDEEYSESHIGIAPGWYVLLSVTDTGEGMDKITATQIFDPFFTTKEIGKGTGLGLSTVYGIIKEHDGHITCYSEPGQGTTFKIYFPAAEAEAATADECPPEDGMQVTSGSETVLMADDEPAIRDIGKAALKNNGYTFLEASSGEEALEIYEAKPDEIDLVILDIGMPGMGGRHCLRRIMKINPRAKVLIASGYSKNGSIKSTFDDGAGGYVAKPFSRAELLKAVREILDA